MLIRSNEGVIAITAEIFRGILIPFLGTSLGALCVVFMKNEFHLSVRRALIGFAAGVMTAASVWSLLIPSMEQSADMGKLAWIPAAVGFIAGIAFLLILDNIIPHLHINAEQAEGPHSRLKKATMLVLAVTLHNIPEGAIISMPLRNEGMSKGKACLYGILSGAVEPIGAVITILAAGLIVPALPYLLSFAAGAMLYVVVEELIPEMSEEPHSNIGTVFFAAGFVIMMILDTALG